MLSRVPNDYVMINSGLGEATPQSLIVIPIIFEDEVRAVIELASFDQFSQIHRIFLEQLSESIGVVLNMIGASTRTRSSSSSRSRSRTSSRSSRANCSSSKSS